MIEIVKKQTYVANCKLVNDSMNTYSEAHISVVDRFSNTVIFKPAYIRAKVENMIAVSLDNGEVVDGEGELPEDAAIHMALYKKYEQINSIAHVHSLKITSYSYLREDIPVISQYQAEHFGASIPCACISQSSISSSEKKEQKVSAVLEKLNGKEVFSKGAILLADDGALVWEKTPLKTLEYARILEKTVAIAWDLHEINRTECDRFSDDILTAFRNKQAKIDYCSERGEPGTQVTFEQIKTINLGLLQYFDKICRQNGIKYSLTGGTLIGAVRQGGLVPWDDDVDVFLTRPEYEKLLKAFSETGRYEFVNFEKDPTFNYPYAWLIDTWTKTEFSTKTAGIGRGISLDVCVVDGLPNNKIRRKLHIKHMRMLFRLRRSTVHDPKSKRYREKGRLVYMIKNIHRRIATVHFWTKRMLKPMKKYPVEKSEYVGNFTSQYGEKEMVHAEVFSHYIDVKFEDLTLMICGGYDEFLTNIYRNYLKFPSKQRQKAHHQYNATWI